MTTHLLAFGWWTRCSRRVHPSRSTADVAAVTCKVCLAHAERDTR